MNIWVTKDGRELLVEEMEPEHFKNALKWVDRRLAEEAAYPSLEALFDPSMDRFVDVRTNLIHRKTMLKEEEQRRIQLGLL